MAFQATVINVMIASPGDVSTERKIIQDELYRWNAANAFKNSLVLMPVAWHSHAAPDLSGRAQGLINERLLDKCDLLVAAFWTRLGTPTGEHESGTVEEIKTHVEAGKPAMVYFSRQPVVPGSYREDQYNAVLKFKAWCQERGITNDYENPLEFGENLKDHLPHILNDNEYLKNLTPTDEVASSDSEKSQTVSFPEEAIDMLRKAATSSDGLITRLRSMSGTSFSAGRQSIEHDGSRRAVAKLDEAVELLDNYGLIKDVGYKGEIFEVTQAGFEAIDSLPNSD